MSFLRFLFSARRSFRHYARLDQQGICRALKHCAQAPAGNDWVEVTGSTSAWLGQPLPAGARITARTRGSIQHPMLAA